MNGCAEERLAIYVWDSDTGRIVISHYPSDDDSDEAIDSSVIIHPDQFDRVFDLLSQARESAQATLDTLPEPAGSES
jgi:hypothetical protein